MACLCRPNRDPVQLAPAQQRCSKCSHAKSLGEIHRKMSAPNGRPRHCKARRNKGTGEPRVV